MRVIILAHLIMWSFFLMALAPWLMLAHNTMAACLINHSQDTCVTTLR